MTRDGRAAEPLEFGGRMSESDHEHKWVSSGNHDLRCACGASHSAIQTVLGAAADDARRLAGDAYYTGCRVRQESETLELWLFSAPMQLFQADTQASAFNLPLSDLRLDGFDSERNLL
jgi:hypothetical protein